MNPQDDKHADLTARLFGELDAASRAELEARLAADAEAAAELAELESALDALRDGLQAPPDAPTTLTDSQRQSVLDLAAAMDAGTAPVADEPGDDGDSTGSIGGGAAETDDAAPAPIIAFPIWQKIAAAVLVAGGVGLIILMQQSSGPQESLTVADSYQDNGAIAMQAESAADAAPAAEEDMVAMEVMEAGAPSDAAAPDVLKLKSADSLAKKDQPAVTLAPMTSQPSPPPAPSRVAPATPAPPQKPAEPPMELEMADAAPAPQPEARPDQRATTRSRQESVAKTRSEAKETERIVGSSAIQRGGAAPASGHGPARDTQLLRDRSSRVTEHAVTVAREERQLMAALQQQDDAAEIAVADAEDAVDADELAEGNTIAGAAAGADMMVADANAAAEADGFAGAPGRGAARMNRRADLPQAGASAPRAIRRAAPAVSAPASQVTVSDQPDRRVAIDARNVPAMTLLQQVAAANNMTVRVEGRLLAFYPSSIGAPAPGPVANAETLAALQELRLDAELPAVPIQQLFSTLHGFLRGEQSVQMQAMVLAWPSPDGGNQAVDITQDDLPISALVQAGRATVRVTDDAIVFDTWPGAPAVNALMMDAAEAEADAAEMPAIAPATAH